MNLFNLIMKENLNSEKSNAIDILEIMSDNLKAFKHSKFF